MHLDLATTSMLAGMVLNEPLHFIHFHLRRRALSLPR